MCCCGASLRGSSVVESGVDKARRLSRQKAQLYLSSREACLRRKGVECSQQWSSAVTVTVVVVIHKKIGRSCDVT